MKSVVEILGPWLPNKGDELMLRAAVEKLRPSHLGVASSDLALQAVPTELGVGQVKWKPTAAEVKTAFASGSVRRVYTLLRRGAGVGLGQSFLRSRGLVDGREVAALFDCSGFAYGDKWPVPRMHSRASYYDRLLARGAKLIMLPQALGPFGTPELQEGARTLFARFHLIFARDSVSAQHVLAVGVKPEKVAVCPDITHLLEAPPPADAQAWATRVCVVPNTRMLDRTSGDVSQQYIRFLLRCIARVHEAGLEPCIIVHEKFDTDLVREILGRLEVPVKVFDENGLVTKSYLGACFANIGSRYHSLVSSLAQATPTIGTSWTHKYEELFAEYQSRDCLLSPADSTDAVDVSLRRFLEPGQREERHSRLRLFATAQKQKVADMWTRVEAMLAS